MRTQNFLCVALAAFFRVCMPAIPAEECFAAFALTVRPASARPGHGSVEDVNTGHFMSALVALRPDPE